MGLAGSVRESIKQGWQGKEEEEDGGKSSEVGVMRGEVGWAWHVDSVHCRSCRKQGCSRSTVKALCVILGGWSDKERQGLPVRSLQSIDLLVIAGSDTSVLLLRHDNFNDH